MALSGSLRSVQLVVGGGAVKRRQPEERLERSHRGAAPVEPEGEVIEVDPEVRAGHAVRRPRCLRLLSAGMPTRR